MDRPSRKQAMGIYEFEINSKPANLASLILKSESQQPEGLHFATNYANTDTNIPEYKTIFKCTNCCFESVVLGSYGV